MKKKRQKCCLDMLAALNEFQDGCQVFKSSVQVRKKVRKRNFHLEKKENERGREEGREKMREGEEGKKENERERGREERKEGVAVRFIF